MNAVWRARLGRLFDAITLESPHAFVLGGRRFAVAGAEAGAPAEPLTALLARVLYRYVYSHAFDGLLPTADEEALQPASSASYLDADPALLAQLTAANATRERWEHGWTIDQILSNGQVQAQRGSLRRRVWPGQFLSHDGPGARLRVGAAISLFYAKESTALQAGFYYLFGETAEAENHAYGVMRLYWNIRAEGAPQLVGALSTSLNRFHVPFRMKCAVALSEYNRTDVAVLYLPKRFAPFACELLPEIVPQVRATLEPDVPFFSRPLAPGLSLAEDPGTGESFGQHRCQRVADAVWHCFLREEIDRDARLDELERLFAAGGVHPEHCHLNAGSTDAFDDLEVLDARTA